MKTISQAVSEYVKSKPFLSSALSDGIINFTSLSRKIKPDIEEILRKSNCRLEILIHSVISYEVLFFDSERSEVHSTAYSRTSIKFLKI